MKTITGREIKVTPNHSKKTFTLRTDNAKYRTIPLNKEEFNSCLNNTGQDWQEFLKSNHYFKIN